MKDEEDGKKNKQRQSQVWSVALQIGLFAGVIWGAVKIAAFYFKFSKVPVSFLAKPFLAPNIINTTAGFWMGWLFYIVFSIFAALLYAALFRRVKGYWGGLIYGAAWWALMTLLVGPSTGMMKWIDRTDWNTILTEACLYLLWGLFIGFSISFEFTDDRHREPESAL